MSACSKSGIELSALDGFRVFTSKHFPYESLDPEKPGQVHAVVNHAEKAIYCSQEYFDGLTAALAKQAPA